MQWTLSAFVLGFGATQILWGALSDRMGRRPTLLIGLSACLVAAAGDVAQLAWWRALEGAGVAAAGVTARAMLRDLHDPVECARLLSIGFSWLGVIGLAAPLTGAVLVDAGGVPLLLGAMAAFGAVALVFVARDGDPGRNLVFRRNAVPLERQIRVDLVEERHPAVVTLDRTATLDDVVPGIGQDVSSEFARLVKGDRTIDIAVLVLRRLALRVAKQHARLAGPLP